MVNILNPTRTNANPLGVIGALFNQPQQSHVSGSQTMPITQPPKVPLPPSPAPTPEELAQPKASDAVIGRPKNLITVDGKDFVVPLTMTQNPRQQAEAQMQQAATEQQQMTYNNGVFTQSNALQQDIQGKIINEPNLNPSSSLTGVETAASVGLKIPVAIGNLISSLVGVKPTTTSEELAKTTFGKFLGLAIDAAGASLAAVELGTLITGTAGAATGASTVATSTHLLRYGTLIGTYIGAGKIYDLNRSDITSMTSAINDAAATSSIIQGNVAAGTDPREALSQLQILSESVDSSEASIKLLATYNIKFRSGQEYIGLQSQVKKARETILGNVMQVQNLALTGKTALNPSQIIYNTNKLQ